MRVIPWTIALAASVLTVACGSSSKSPSPSPTSSAQALQSFCQKARDMDDAGAQLNQLIAATPGSQSQRSQQAVTLSARFAALAKQMAAAAPSTVKSDAGYVAGVVDGVSQTIAQTSGDLSALRANLDILRQDATFAMSLTNLQQYLASKCT